MNSLSHNSKFLTHTANSEFSPSPQAEVTSIDFKCPSHQIQLESCDDCNDRLISGFLVRKKNAQLIKKCEIEKDSIETIKGELELLKAELNDLCQVVQVPAAFNNIDLYFDFLITRPLPKCLFAICETAESALSFMFRQGIFQNNSKCQKCGQTMRLQGRGGIGFVYKCTSCKARRDYKFGTFWERVNLPPNQILWFMLLYMVKARNIEIAHLMGLSENFARDLGTRVRKIISQDYLDNLPVFNGVVEITVKNFVKKKIEIGKSKTKAKWVLIMVERGRKLSHMEPIPEKKFSVIFPIIQKRVEVGTIIITEAWGIFGRLENYGYPHYTLDIAKGFAHTVNTKIHISNVYGQWSWIRYAVKQYNRISLKLGEHLNEFQWRRLIRRKYEKITTKILESMLALALKVVTCTKPIALSESNIIIL